MTLDQALLDPRLRTSVRERIGAAIGAEHVSDSELDRIAYGHDTWPVALKDPATARWRPDLVAWPGSVDHLVAIVRIAADSGVAVVPVGGLSGIVGGALALRGGILVDLLRMSRVLELDRVSGLVRVEAGAIGENVEAELARERFTLGHYPQSIRSSTVGGWIGHRAAGIASTRYGKIESLLRGLRVVLADGRILEVPAQPASAAGIDLTRLFLGAEGTLGIVAEATLLVHRVPAVRRWEAWSLAAFDDALEAVRAVLQRGYRPAIVRAYDPDEAEGHLRRAGRVPGTALLLVGAEGEEPIVRAELAALKEEVGARRGEALGPGPAEAWFARRFDTSGLLGAVRGQGEIGDALEVAAPWSRLPEVYRAMRTRLLTAAGPDAHVHVHLSHAYPDGANLYVIFRARLADDEVALAAYPRLVDAALGACLDAGGTVSHHHGIGVGKRRWLERELGPVGVETTRALKGALDPERILNPGKLGDVA